MTLTPRAGGAPCLVFAPNPIAPSPDGGDPYYLVPSGSFDLSVEIVGSAAPRLMLGTSAIEYVGLPATSGNVLTFTPGQPAYAPSFAGSNGTTGGPVLRDGATTAYAYVTNATTNPTYYTQPDDSVLYHLVGTATDPKGAFLDYMEVVSRPLPPSAGPSFAFPTAPYGNLENQPNDAEYGAFEA